MNTCPKCASANVISVEYAYGSVERYDGISEYWCQDCDYRQGRWTGKKLLPGQVEPRFGEGEPYTPDLCKCGKEKNPKYPTCFDCHCKRELKLSPSEL